MCRHSIGSAVREGLPYTPDIRKIRGEKRNKKTRESINRMKNKLGYVYNIHYCRMKRFSGQDLGKIVKLKEVALHDAAKFVMPPINGNV